MPEVDHEVVGEGHMAFKVRKKNFAYYCFDHHGDGIIGFWCKSTGSEQRRLIKDDPESLPAYVGARGWIAIRLNLETVDWEAAAELSHRAYQSVAPRKLAALLE